MQGHLSDEQLAELLTGADDAGTRSHIVACAACRDESEGLRASLARYGEETCAASERPEAFWRWQQAAIAARVSGYRPRWQLTWASAAAILVLIAALLCQQPPATEPLAANDPDHALLVDVEHSVRREVPRALEPAALLAQEVSRAAETNP